MLWRVLSSREEFAFDILRIPLTFNPNPLNSKPLTLKKKAPAILRKRIAGAFFLNLIIRGEVREVRGRFLLRGEVRVARGLHHDGDDLHHGGDALRVRLWGEPHALRSLPASL